MSILIKGMEMPDSCFLCRFCRRQEYGEYVGEDTAWSCVASKKRITEGQDLIATFKHPDCPLVEAPDTQTEKKSLNGEQIERQAAIDEIDEWIKAFLENGHKESAADACLIQDGIMQLPSAQPERKRMSNKEWIDFLSEQFDVSRTSAREMLHGLMKWKAEDNFKKQFRR